MQQIQTTVLNKLQPGVNPIFIISPQTNDGEALSLLLSYNLDPVNSNDSGAYAKPRYRTTNYFSVDDITAQLQQIEKQSNESTLKEQKDSLDYLFTKHFDNGKLWGLQLSYQVFLSLDLKTQYPNAFFIFVVGSNPTNTLGSDPETALLEKIYTFHKDNTGNSTLVHANHPNFLGAQILANLNYNQRASTSSIEDESFETLLASRDRFPFKWSRKDVATSTAYSKLFNECLIVKDQQWFSGDGVQTLLLVDNYDPKALHDKVYQVLMSFLTAPQICVICRNDGQIAEIKDGLTKTFGDLNINVVHAADSLTKTIDQQIGTSNCGYILIDNLNLNFSLVQQFAAFRQSEKPSFCISNLLANKIISISSGRLLLPDLLSTRILLENVSFSREVWSKNGGLDHSMPEETAIWEFCIRTLLVPNGFALETTAYLSRTDDKEDRQNHETNKQLFSPVLEKHKRIFSANLDEILQLVSENQYVPQAEIKELTSKIYSLDTVITHSKNELQSVNEFNNNLQVRIQQLESSKWYRLSEKIKHYKNLFFRKKGQGGGGAIKRILKFIFFAFSKAGLGIIRKFAKRLFRKLYLWSEDKPVKIVYLDEEQVGNYANYNDYITEKLDIDTIRDEYAALKDSLTLKPKISVIMPVYNPPLKYLKEAIESVMDQPYENWELCMADDLSPDPQVRRLLNAYASKDSRIKVALRTENGHISACTNSALAIATGDYYLFMDHDDKLANNCLQEVVRHINANPQDDFIYSDEDKIDDKETHSTPFFKPDWSPDRLLAINYINHVTVIARSLMDKVKGFRLGFEGSQDYDLFLRATEKAQHIGHIPKILYHWRIHSASIAASGDAKVYAYIAAKKALEEAFERRNISAEVHYGNLQGCYRINYNINTYKKVTIIIPTKDQVGLMRNTLDSIFALTSYPDYEVIVLNNNSTTKEFFELMKHYERKHSDIFKCVDANFPFNFAKLMNVGVGLAKGEYMLLLNNDVEILSKDWITKMVSYAQQERIGAIGVKLLFPDDNIQHAGTVIGLGGIAGHVLAGTHKDQSGYFNCLQTVDNYSAVTAACLMVRKDVYLEVGGMEEALEVEFNDVDFCLRVLEKGYNNVYLPEVVLYHYESATRGHPHQNKASYERHLREVALFKEKWGKYIDRDPFYNPNLTLTHVDMRLNMV